MVFEFRRIARTFSCCVLMLSISLLSIEGGAADVHESQSETQTLVTDGEHSTHQHPQESNDGHGVHLCHCAHTHVAVASIVGYTPRITTYPVARAALFEGHLWSSRTPDPEFRPPIA